MRCWFGWALWLSAIRTVKLLVVDRRFCRAKPSNEESRAKPSYENQRVDEGFFEPVSDISSCDWVSLLGQQETVVLYLIAPQSSVVQEVRTRGWTKVSLNQFALPHQMLHLYGLGGWGISLHNTGEKTFFSCMVEWDADLDGLCGWMQFGWWSFW